MVRKWSNLYIWLVNKTHNDHHNTNHTERPSKTKMVESHSHRLGDIFWPQSSHHINWFSGFCPSSKILLEIPPQKKVWMVETTFQSYQVSWRQLFPWPCKEKCWMDQSIASATASSKDICLAGHGEWANGSWLEVVHPWKRTDFPPENQWLESMYSQLK